MGALCTTDTAPKHDTKIIAIMGATGNQGGSVVKAFQALKESGNHNFEIRAITRDPTSEQAKAVQPFVKEIVKADANDVDSMVEAFKGCYGAFLVSNFWQDMNVINEMNILRNLKEAVKKADVKHIVLSTLEGSKDYVNGSDNKDTWVIPKGYEELGMYVPHFDGKWEVTTEFEKEGLPVTNFLTSCYYENFISMLGPNRQSDSDPYGITLPMEDAKLQLVAVEDIGKAVCAIFQDRSLIGKTVGIKSDELTGQEIADVFAKVCNQEVLYNKVPWKVFASFGFPGADELSNMFRFYSEYADVCKKNRELDDEFLKTMGGIIPFEAWVTANKESFDFKK